MDFFHKIGQHCCWLSKEEERGGHLKQNALHIHIGKVKILPAVTFYLIPVFPTSLCKAWIDKPMINMHMFAFECSCMHNSYIDPQRLSYILKFYHQIDCF